MGFYIRLHQLYKKISAILYRNLKRRLYDYLRYHSSEGPMQ